MKLRPPSTPLVTVDPYFSIWSAGEELNHSHTLHWTGVPHSVVGYIIVDGTPYTFLGYDRNARKLKQTYKDVSALSTVYTLENDLVRVSVRFTSTLLPDDLDLLSRPISYMSVSYEKISQSVRRVELRVCAEKWLCLDRHHQSPVVLEELSIDGISGFRFGNSVQKILNKSGDDARIDWGYFYLCAACEGRTDEYLVHSGGECPSLTVNATDREGEGKGVLFMLAYDDIRSIDYFGDQLKSYWKRGGESIETLLVRAARDYDSISARCDAFSDKLIADAYIAGGEKYADLLTLAYRQSIAAHKLVLDGEGRVLFISKECFSNGCAATVDITYPTSPVLLKYNTELLRGTLRPIYDYVRSGRWKFDFAPHDVGQYPLLLGQVYGYDGDKGVFKYEDQMPVEECGNMIITEANIALADGNADFAREHIDILQAWAEYLIKFGADPEDQLCTDDFAGHLAHNCNLSLKAIMGIMGMSIIIDMLGDAQASEKYAAIARDMASSWCERARDASGAYRLAFDKEGSRSMKYNMIWDKLWGTGLFPDEVYASETEMSIRAMNRYGTPLDSRCDQTKSDWLAWTAAMAPQKRDFERLIAPLWRFYNETPSRVPMTDWYDTVSGRMIGFQNRAVIGGLFIKLLDNGILKYKK